MRDLDDLVRPFHFRQVLANAHRSQTEGFRGLRRAAQRVQGRCLRPWRRAAAVPLAPRFSLACACSQHLRDILR